MRLMSQFSENRSSRASSLVFGSHDAVYQFQEKRLYFFGRAKIPAEILQHLNGYVVSHVHVKERLHCDLSRLTTSSHDLI